MQSLPKHRSELKFKQNIFQTKLAVCTCDLAQYPPRFDWIFPCQALDPIFSKQDAGVSEFRSIELYGHFIETHF